MANLHVPFHLKEGGWSYVAKPSGRDAGHPSVTIELEAEPENIRTVEYIKARIENYNWHKKLRSGHAFMTFTGEEPLHERYVDGITSLLDIVGPRYLSFEVSGKHIPPRIIDSQADNYTLNMPLEVDDPLEYEWFAERSRRFDNAEFIFHVSVQRDQGRIEDIRRRFKIHGSNVYVAPAGDTLDEILWTYPVAHKIAKRKTWTLSPRHDILMQAGKEARKASAQ